MITIGRVKQNKLNAENIYIGRGSPLGNPYPINAHQDRNTVCDKYEIYLRKVLQDKSSPQYAEMLRLLELHKSGVNLHLQCFCKPLRCHGDTIKAILQSL